MAPGDRASAELESRLKGPIDAVRLRASRVLDEFERRSKQDALSWIDPATGSKPAPAPRDAGPLRRLAYVYEQVMAALGVVKRSDLIESEYSEWIEQLRDSFEKEFERFARAHRKLSANPPSYLLNLLRSIHGSSEHSSFGWSSVDADLFNACYALTQYADDLLPEERSIIYKKILNEAQLYTTKEQKYQDLSTVWWAVALLGVWRRLAPDDWIDLVRGLVDLAPSDKPEDEHFLTEEGKQTASDDRSGDLVTVRRSLVFSHSNAVEIRKAVKNLRDPRLLPLASEIRRFSDSCARLWLQKTEENLGLYEWALDLRFCVDWWVDRIRNRRTALKVLSGEEDVAKWDLSSTQGLPGVATGQELFAARLREIGESVGLYRAAGAQKRPLVVAIFGGPGTGKSWVAERIPCAEQEMQKEDFIDLNLSVLESPIDLFVLLRSDCKDRDNPVVFLDEFDVQRNGTYWYPWLLTLLWEGAVPGENHKLEPLLSRNMVVCLAASRYETYADFREFALSPVGKAHKAPDVLSRIDAYVDIPPLKPEDRVLVMRALTHGKASKELLALCYVAEIEDNARGLARLLKGVDTANNRRVDVIDLLPLCRKELQKAAGM